MMPLSSTISIAAFWIVAFVTGQLSWTQLSKRPRYSQILTVSFLASVISFVLTMILADYFFWHLRLLALAAALVAGLLVMACCFILYTPFIFVISSSLSVDTIIMLSRHGGTMRMDALYDQFVSTEAVNHRLRMMQGNGLLTYAAGRYFLTTKARRLALFFTRMKYLWKLWPGG